MKTVGGSSAYGLHIMEMAKPASVEPVSTVEVLGEMRGERSQYEIFTKHLCWAIISQSILHTGQVKDMAVLPIRCLPDPLLQKRAKRVSTINTSVHKLIDDMIDTMRAASGVGLAGPQVAAGLRIIVVGLPGQEVVCLINPEIVKKKGERLVDEACLSIPGYHGEVKRSIQVTVKGLSKQKREFRLKAEGLLAQVLEHEIDHLNGILYVDRLESPDMLQKVEPEELASSTASAGPAAAKTKQAD